MLYPEVRDLRLDTSFDTLVAKLAVRVDAVAVLQVILHELVQVDNFQFLGFQCIFQAGSVGKILNDHADPVDPSLGCFQVLAPGVR